MQLMMLYIHICIRISKKSDILIKIDDLLYSNPSYIAILRFLNDVISSLTDFYLNIIVSSPDELLSQEVIPEVKGIVVLKELVSSSADHQLRHHQTLNIGCHCNHMHHMTDMKL